MDTAICIIYEAGINLWCDLTTLKYDEDASYFSVTINGVQIGKVQSEITKPMTNVNVYAGDNYLPAANAKYNNLIWEEISGGIYININQKFS